MRTYDPKLKKAAQELRKNMTDAERRLWSKLRKKQLNGFFFSSQKPIGGYIVDFYCHKASLVIEVDGGQHLTDEGIEYDKVRDASLKSMELTILRFTNTEVLNNINGVLQVIVENLS